MSKTKPSKQTRKMEKRILLFLRYSVSFPMYF